MDDRALAEHLRRLEEELLRPEVRASRAALEDLLAPDFRELGASGRVYDRESIVAALGAETSRVQVAIEDLVLRRLAPGVALVTYRTRPADGGQPAARRAANRSSIWTLDGERWRLVFHQGTPSF